MRTWVVAAFLAAGAGAGPGEACRLNWPNAEVEVPGDVLTFIAAECRAARGSSEETEAECVRAEAYGYRAQVTMLTDPEIAEAATARYRACSGGMGMIGGKFHRRKADCMGGAFEIIWRFEFSRETHVRGAHPVRFADAAGDPLPGAM